MGNVVDKMVLEQFSPLIIILPMIINHLSSEFAALGKTVVAAQRSSLIPILQLRELFYKW
jgi:hypothetical protein